jgi:hypothetical protein
MATYHMRIKSHGKGHAADRSKYIAREGKYVDRSEDLVATGSGNLPECANGNPNEFFKSADRYERANGCACRELELALPVELTVAQQKEILHEFINGVIGDKPYQYAIHHPAGSLSGQSNPHAHVLYSDRVSDGIERSLDQMFRRYNPHYPSRGGCPKDSGGKEPQTLREEMLAQRKLLADIQNSALEKYGHAARVDHRSYKDQGIEREPEQHLGPAYIRRMSDDDKAQYIETRTSRPSSPAGSGREPSRSVMPR